MSPKEFSEIAAAIAWPVTSVAFVVLFYKPVRALLDRLAATLSVKTVKLKAFGAEIELTPEQAKHAWTNYLKTSPSLRTNSPPRNRLCSLA